MRKEEEEKKEITDLTGQGWYGDWSVVFDDSNMYSCSNNECPFFNKRQYEEAGNKCPTCGGEDVKIYEKE